MVPDLLQHIILSAITFADADYISIYDVNEVNIYDGRTAKIRISEAAVLKCWRFPVSKLWCIPLKSNITNPNTETLLLNSPGGHQSRNPIYFVPTIKITVHHVQTLMTKHTLESVNNVYELPSFERTITYIHAAAGFPTKSMWLKDDQRGNYLTWPLVNIKNVTKFFPESEKHKKKT